MGAKASKNFVSRSPRLPSQPKEFSNFVRFDTDSQNAPGKAAQFADVSASGMRLISREPTSARVGDPLIVEFTVPGEERTIKNGARIVRKINEFVFAVRFEDLREKEKRGLQAAIARYLEATKWAPLLRPWKHLKDWSRTHRQGLWVALIGALLLCSVGTYIYLNSDEHLGHELRSWGKPYPRQWDWDWYNHINKPSK